MDKSCALYSGIIIYRFQRNIIEYLLFNDTFSKKKHWSSPKGQVIGKEDELKCALREAFEVTGLRPSDLKIREEFVAKFTYLSGTKPKKVNYYLAQVANPQIRLPNAQGIHLQWCTITIALEKVIFKTMQQLLQAIEKYIEEHPRPTTPEAVTASTTAVKSGGAGGGGMNKLESNPLYKTRLCERYELEGTCSYGSRCNFAHGVTELRGKKEEDTQVEVEEIQQVEDPATTTTTTTLNEGGNHLFKTKLCERFMRDQFCQYGPKCHFAHGEAELKERPKKEEPELTMNNQRLLRLEKKPSSSQMMSNNNNQPESINRSDSASSWRSPPTTPVENRSSSGNWRTQLESVNNQLSQMAMRKENNTNNQKFRGSENPVSGRADQEDSWRSKTPDTSNRSDTNGSWRSKTLNNNASAVKMAPNENNEASSDILKDLRRPAFTDHQKKHTKSKAASSNNVTETEKSWMKIVKLTKEEQDELQIENKTVTTTKTSNVSSQNGTSNVEENIISELKKFFTAQKPTITKKGKIADDVKEVTKMEMRNDLSKSQLLFILFASLLEDSEQANATSSGVLSILKSRNHIFKMHVKTEADQLLLLKAWGKFIKIRKPSMVGKTPATLSYWYDVELVEEEVFVNWYDTLEKDSPIEKKSAKFIEWLSTAEEEEDD